MGGVGQRYFAEKNERKCRFHNEIGTFVVAGEGFEPTASVL